MKKSLLISSMTIATILLGGTAVSADVTTGTTQPGTTVVSPGTDTNTPTPGTTPGTDISTPTPGTDTSTPTPGTTPGTDTSTPTPGTDTSTPTPGTTPGTDTNTPTPGTTPGTDANTPTPGTTPGTDTNTPTPGTTPGTDTNTPTPGTSTPTSPIVNPTPEAPVDLGNNKIITGISNGMATLADGSSSSLTDLGAKENGNDTYTIKTKDNKLVTLPHTGEHSGLIMAVVGFILLAAGTILTYKRKKSDKE
ncbi:TPA: LPXTG cell wall anchor domain-containing protein [Streptococcus agalactiae]|nr:LPXTG cell wall anchor domain-containing protein [Streptococcus agalactiae]